MCLQALGSPERQLPPETVFAQDNNQSPERSAYVLFICPQCYCRALSRDCLPDFHWERLSAVSASQSRRQPVSSATSQGTQKTAPEALEAISGAWGGLEKQNLGTGSLARGWDRFYLSSLFLCVNVCVCVLWGGTCMSAGACLCRSMKVKG